jgi:hypothetical protein
MILFGILFRRIESLVYTTQSKLPRTEDFIEAADDKWRCFSPGAFSILMITLKAFGMEKMPTQKFITRTKTFYHKKRRIKRRSSECSNIECCVEAAIISINSLTT